MTASSALRARGFHGATMTEIAEAAGTSKIVLYRYFGSKDELIAELLRGVRERLLALDAREDRDWRSRHESILRFARAHPDPVVLLLRHAPQDPGTRPIWREYREQIVERTSARLAALKPPEVEVAPGLEFCAETLTHFIFDAIARHVDRAPATRDEAFTAWLNRSVAALTSSWLRLP
ncbi:MAG: helix-turn-helix domain-containing protein [Pseudomonadota bacterium]